MKIIGIQLLGMLLVLAFSHPTFAEFMTLSLSTDKISYQVGETVNWTARFDIGGSTATNFGIATISINLRDSQGNTLSPALVNNTFPPTGFAGYFRFSGAWNPATLRLEEVGAALQQNNFTVVGSNGSQLTNILLAQGSYVVTSSGNHTLIGSLGTTNNYFTTFDGLNTANLPSYAPLTFNNANFNVIAVPEPSSLAFLSLAGFSFAVVRRSRRS